MERRKEDGKIERIWKDRKKMERQKEDGKIERRRWKDRRKKNERWKEEDGKVERRQKVASRFARNFQYLDQRCTGCGIFNIRGYGCGFYILISADIGCGC